MDAVYIVKPGDVNEELRFSLRSLAKNMRYVDRVFVAGFCPSWMRNVVPIELVPLEEKFANMRQSLAAACADPRVSDEFVLLNDDHFALAPLDDLPAWHLGPLSRLIEWHEERGFTDSDVWFVGLKRTLEQMREWGHPDPDAYEAHTPLVFNKARLGDALARATVHPFLWGAAYDACGGQAGLPGENVKVAELGARELLTCMAGRMPFLSTEDDAFTSGKVGELVRSMFPDPCIYEEAS